jgi:glycosyltransferase involved in cell wall biosynthesis
VVLRKETSLVRKSEIRSAERERPVLGQPDGPVTGYPFVSIILPCFNSEEFIGGSLDSIVANDYPKHYLEVLCVDGMSNDSTRTIVADYSNRYPWIRLIDNPKRIIPAALNMGIQASLGDVIIRTIAHCVWNSKYVSSCVRFLNEYKADNVGGVWMVLPRRPTVFGKAIALALTHRFGAGNAHYKTGRLSSPRWADVVGIGCSKRQVFDRIGLFNEDLERSEDVEFNDRLRRNGGKTLLVPGIISHYYARSKLGEFTRHNALNGYWVTYPLKFVRNPFSWRHWAPLAFVSVLISLALLSLIVPKALLLVGAILAVYLCVSGIGGAEIGIKQKDARYLAVMPVVFASLHFPYGLGSLGGLAAALCSKRFWLTRLGPSSRTGGKAEGGTARN